MQKESADMMNAQSSHDRRRRLRFLLTFGCLIMVAASSAWAQGDGGTTATADPEQTITLWDTIRSGGVIGLLIILVSLVSVALIIEHFLSIRRQQMLPEHLIDRLEAHLNAEEYREAQDDCAQDGSFIALVIGAGLNQVGAMFGFFDMQNAMQEASERQINKLHRKLEYLAFIAASAPMLGLLGTVLGMIDSFNEIALTEGTARPSQLAGGISKALVTTCMGLVVAIPTMFFVSFFRNRIDGFVAEAETAVEKLMGRFRSQTAR